MRNFPVFCLFIALSIIGCKKNNNNPNPNPNPNQPGGNDDSLVVYLAGKDASGEPSPPGFWKNEVRTNLPTTAGGDANSIFVDGSNVYVAGRDWLNNAQTRYAPCYWLSGNRITLPLLDDRGDGMINSILAFNGVVYAAGTCTDSLEFFGNNGWRYLPVYWKNGEIVRLETLDGFGGGFGESITLQAVSNDIVPYIVGSSHAESGYDEPCYWKIDPGEVITGPDVEIEPTALSNKGYGGGAKCASPGAKGAFNQTQIYIAGWVDNADEFNDPCYWAGGSRVDLSKISEFGHGVANGIDVSGNDVYVAGYSDNNVGTRIPCIWKNGTRTDLSLPANVHSGEATSCKVHDGDVYVAGTISTDSGEYPCYWKNGGIVQYNTPGTASSIAVRDN